MPQPNRIIVPKIKPVHPRIAWLYWATLVVGLPLAVALWH